MPGNTRRVMDGIAHRGVTDYESMATKTVLRSLLSKWGIMSVELQTALVTEIVRQPMII